MKKLGCKIELYRTALIRKKAEVLGLLGIKFDTMAALGRVAEDDQAQISHDEFISLHVNSIGYQLLKDVSEALERIENSEYGFCERCEEPIPEKRLRAVPWARYCVTCQDTVGQSDDPGAEEHHHPEPVGTF